VEWWQQFDLLEIMYENKSQLGHNDKDAPYKHVKEGQMLTRMLGTYV
jgi:hypothetical protein